jgi:hypothetical protein
MEAKEARPSEVSRQDCQAQDLICGKSAFLLWCLPICAIFVGLGWPEARPWLWVPAFLLMGVACVVNAARCGRLHCFVTGPIFLLSAAYVAVAAFGLLPKSPRILLLVVLGITLLAFCAESFFGRYRYKTRT